MYNKLSLPSTPALARLATRMQAIDNITISDEVAELAVQYSFDTDDVLVEQAAKSDFDFIQMQLDYLHRMVCVVWDIDTSKIMQNICMAAHFSDSKNVAIFVPNQQYFQQFVKTIEFLFPNDEIVKNTFNHDAYGSRTTTHRVWYVVANPKDLAQRDNSEVPVIYDQLVIVSNPIHGSTPVIPRHNYFSSDEYFLAGLATEITKTTILLIAGSTANQYKYDYLYGLFDYCFKQILKQNNTIINHLVNNTETTFFAPNASNGNNFIMCLRSKKIPLRWSAIFELAKIYIDVDTTPDSEWVCSTFGVNHFMSSNRMEIQERYNHIIERKLDGKTIEEFLQNGGSVNELKPAQWLHAKKNSVFRYLSSQQEKSVGADIKYTFILTTNTEISSSITNSLKKSELSDDGSFKRSNRFIIVDDLKKIPFNVLDHMENLVIPEVPETKAEYEKIKIFTEQNDIRLNILVSLNTVEEQLCFNLFQ